VGRGGEGEETERRIGLRRAGIPVGRAGEREVLWRAGEKDDTGGVGLGGLRVKEGNPGGTRSGPPTEDTILESKIQEGGWWGASWPARFWVLGKRCGGERDYRRGLRGECGMAERCQYDVCHNQSINQILKAPHEHKRSHIHIPAQPHGQQTPRREASQAWGAKSESRKR